MNIEDSEDDIGVLIAQKQEELDKINQLRINALQKIITGKTEHINKLQETLRE